MEEGNTESWSRFIDLQDALSDQNHCPRRDPPNENDSKAHYRGWTNVCPHHPGTIWAVLEARVRIAQKTERQ